MRDPVSPSRWGTRSTTQTASLSNQRLCTIHVCYQWTDRLNEHGTRRSLILLQTDFEAKAYWLHFICSHPDMHLVVPGTCNETVDYIMLIMYMVCQKITVYYEAPVFEAATNILKA